MYQIGLISFLILALVSCSICQEFERETKKMLDIARRDAEIPERCKDFKDYVISYYELSADKFTSNKLYEHMHEQIKRRIKFKDDGLQVIMDFIELCMFDLSQKSNDDQRLFKFGSPANSPTSSPKGLELGHKDFLNLLELFYKSRGDEKQKTVRCEQFLQYLRKRAFNDFFDDKNIMLKAEEQFRARGHELLGKVEHLLGDCFEFYKSSNEGENISSSNKQNYNNFERDIESEGESQPASFYQNYFNGPYFDSSFDSAPKRLASLNSRSLSANSIYQRRKGSLSPMSREKDNCQNEIDNLKELLRQKRSSAKDLSPKFVNSDRDLYELNERVLELEQQSTAQLKHKSDKLKKAYKKISEIEEALTLLIHRVKDTADKLKESQMRIRELEVSRRSKLIAERRKKKRTFSESDQVSDSSTDSDSTDSDTPGAKTLPSFKAKTKETIPDIVSERRKLRTKPKPESIQSQAQAQVGQSFQQPNQARHAQAWASSAGNTFSQASVSAI